MPEGYQGQYGVYPNMSVTNGVPSKSYYDQSQIDAINSQYHPLAGNYRLIQGPGAVPQQQVPYQAASRVAEGQQVGIDNGWSRNVSNIVGDPGERNITSSGAWATRTNAGSRTGLSPAEIGRQLGAADKSGSKPKNYSDLIADMNDIPQEIHYVASLAYDNAKTGSPGSQNNTGSRTSSGSQPGQYASPLVFPSYSGNPAGGYTNQTALGPVGMGPVTINQVAPTDLGWSTGSAYDQNTGLSKWSSSGLTNGEAYYNNQYAQIQNAEAQRRAESAASSAAAYQRRVAAGERQDVRNEVVDYLVATTGRDKSLVRMDVHGLSDEALLSKAGEMANYNDMAQQQQSESALNDLLQQFTNPNYSNASQTGSQPSYSSATVQNQAGGDVDAQYQQAVQQQQAQYQQQQQQQDAALQQQQQDLQQQYQQQLDSANAANNARYEDIIAGYQDNQANIDNYLTNQGQQQTEDVNRSYERLGANNRQDLISRGLGNTTVLSSTERGIEEDRQRALRNSQEQIDRQRLTYQTSAQSDLLGAMERRTDAGPDYNQLIGLSQGLGNSQNAGGAYGGGTNTASAYGFQQLPVNTNTAYQANENPSYNPEQYGQPTNHAVGQGIANAQNALNQEYDAMRGTDGNLTEQQGQQLATQNIRLNDQADQAARENEYQLIRDHFGTAPPGSTGERRVQGAAWNSLSALDQDRWRYEIQQGRRTAEDFANGQPLTGSRTPQSQTQVGGGTNSPFISTGINAGGARVNRMGQTVGEFNQQQSQQQVPQQQQLPQYGRSTTGTSTPQYQPIFNQSGGSQGDGGLHSQPYRATGQQAQQSSGVKLGPGQSMGSVGVGINPQTKNITGLGHSDKGNGGKLRINQQGPY